MRIGCIQRTELGVLDDTMAHVDDEKPQLHVTFKEGRQLYVRDAISIALGIVVAAYQDVAMQPVDSWPASETGRLDGWSEPAAGPILQ